jgi:rhodanese-related sulfurtransferase
MQVARFLHGQGFDTLANLAGGIDAWSMERDPSVARY